MINTIRFWVKLSNKFFKNFLNNENATLQTLHVVGDAFQIGMLFNGEGAK